MLYRLYKYNTLYEESPTRLIPLQCSLGSLAQGFAPRTCASASASSPRTPPHANRTHQLMKARYTLNFAC